MTWRLLKKPTGMDPARLGTATERTPRQGLRIDKDRSLPRLQKHEFAESAQCLRSYLELAPNAKDGATRPK